MNERQNLIRLYKVDSTESICSQFLNAALNRNIQILANDAISNLTNACMVKKAEKLPVNKSSGQIVETKLVLNVRQKKTNDK